MMIERRSFLTGLAAAFAAPAIVRADVLMPIKVFKQTVVWVDHTGLTPGAVRSIYDAAKLVEYGGTVYLKRGHVERLDRSFALPARRIIGDAVDDLIGGVSYGNGHAHFRNDGKVNFKLPHKGDIEVRNLAWNTTYPIKPWKDSAFEVDMS